MATGNDSRALEGRAKERRARVLVLDSNPDRARALSRRLEFLDYEPILVGPELTALHADEVAVVVADAGTDENVAATASRLRAEAPGLPFLCIGNAAAAERGPNWSLDLPLKRCQLERLLRRAVRYQGRERRHRITGTSHPVRQVRRFIEQVADFDTNVLVTGESGTGKELVARTIHDLSERAEEPFVPINCGAIPPELLESELFGHEKGAFTGAVSTRQGRFELAEGGTLFLDEIGEMSLDMQVKLLRVLQERTFERVGSNKEQQCNVRIIAATHVDLPEAVQQGGFREDLFYRLNVFPIEMPPLYKRLSDLPQLLQELLIANSGNDECKLRVSPEAMRMLASYRWPGNIRELSNLVERLAIMKPEGTIDIDDLPDKYRTGGASPVEDANNVSAAMQLSEANLKSQLRAVEQDLIGQAMAATDGVVAKAARLLSMRRTTLVEKIGKYGLD